MVYRDLAAGRLRLRLQAVHSRLRPGRDADGPRPPAAHRHRRHGAGASKLPTAQTFTFPGIPNLSITVPPGTILTLEGGGRPDPFPLLAVQLPVDRLPGPMPPNPSTVVPFIVGFQPELATTSLPIAVYFPNVLVTPPGTHVSLTTLDPTKGIMVMYGTGVISPDGKQIFPISTRPIPDCVTASSTWAGTALCSRHLRRLALRRREAASVRRGQTRRSRLRPGRDDETDLTLPGARGGGVSIVRTYRTLSTDAGPFGLGASHNYDFRLDNNTPQNAVLVNLILPDGKRVPFTRDTSGNLMNSNVPDLAGAVLTTAADRTSQLRFKQGTVLHFIPADI